MRVVSITVSQFRVRLRWRSTGPTKEAEFVGCAPPYFCHLATALQLGSTRKIVMPLCFLTCAPLIVQMYWSLLVKYRTSSLKNRSAKNPGKGWPEKDPPNRSLFFARRWKNAFSGALQMGLSSRTNSASEGHGPWIETRLILSWVSQSVDGHQRLQGPRPPGARVNFLFRGHGEKVTFILFFLVGLRCFVGLQFLFLFGASVRGCFLKSGNGTRMSETLQCVLCCVVLCCVVLCCVVLCARAGG